MSKCFTITTEDMVREVKLSCKIPSICQAIVSRAIIKEHASKLNIEVSDEELQKSADSLRLMNNIPTAQQTWCWLEKHRLSLDEFEEIAYMNLISSKLAARLFSEQVEPYFYEHQLDYLAVSLYDIILEDQDLALELYYSIHEEEMSFAEVARQYVSDVELSRRGGYLGIVRRWDLQPEISAAVFSSNPPQLLKPIITSEGVHLLRVEEIIKADLDETLRYQITLNLFEQWLKKEVERVAVVIVV